MVAEAVTASTTLFIPQSQKYIEFRRTGLQSLDARNLTFRDLP